MSLVVLCPSRGRPWGALAALESFEQTASNGSIMRFIVDEDDDHLDSYRHLDLPLVVIPPQGGMVADLNYAASAVLMDPTVTFLSFIGDDHRFRTPGWDTVFMNTLTANGGGFAYGNDLFWQHGEIPTQIMISANIVAELGWMALPSCRHLYVDNVWKELGEASNSLFYFPRFIIEHLHPAAGKAEWDEQYRLVNSEERYAADRQAFETWMATQASEDFESVRRALARAIVARRDPG